MSVVASLFYRSKMLARSRSAYRDSMGAFGGPEVSGPDQVGDIVAD
jgi:hypothetical protein